MTEEKCDHLVGYEEVSDGYGEIDNIVFGDSERADCDLDFAFKFCPLCGVEIEGYLTK